MNVLKLFRINNIVWWWTFGGVQPIITQNFYLFVLYIDKYFHVKNFVRNILFLCLCILFNSTKGQQSGDATVLVEKWNTANNKKDIGILIYLYDKEVLFYGTKLPKSDCISGKLSIFKKYPNLDQQVQGLNSYILENGDIKCLFQKAVNVNGTIKTYSSYLIWHKIGEVWKIIVEGDETTDANVEKKKMKAKGAIKCDVDGDGKTEYAWMEFAREDTSGKWECLDGDSCNAYIRFSNKSIPPIKLPGCIGGWPENLKDMNSTKGDEIGIDYGFHSCWRLYKVFSYKDGKWEKVVQDIQTHCDIWEVPGYKPVEKDPYRPGYVLIHYWNMGEFPDKPLTKSVPIK